MTPSQTSEHPCIASINFGRWSDRIRYGDPDALSHLYADEATFHPTLSDQFAQGRKEIAEYFSYFLELRPVASLVESKIKLLANKTLCLHSGIYRFDFNPSKETSHYVKDRFSFLWEYHDGDWLITHHHSSATPMLSKS